MDLKRSKAGKAAHAELLADSSQGLPAAMPACSQTDQFLSAKLPSPVGVYTMPTNLITGLQNSK